MPMKADEFIKKHGVEEAKKAHAMSINLGHEDLELKELIESHELVISYGGLEKAKSLASSAENISWVHLTDQALQAIADVESCQ